jgi:hypothetical protein
MNEPKFKVGQTVTIDGFETGKIIEYSFNFLDGNNYYLTSIKGQQDVYVLEKFLSISETNTLDNLQAILKAMNEISTIDRSDYFNNYMSEVEWRIKAIETLNELGKLPS